MVAAWMSADTGVGPSIASSSQDCSGTCADLPQAASSSIRPSSVAQVLDRPSAPAFTEAKAEEPNRPHMLITASERPMSPTRLTTKAFLAATAADVLCCQNPISRYDARPTPSQPTNTSR